MSDALTCSGCQKRYVWKAVYAGRKVKCRCGQVLVMPAQDPAAAAAPYAPDTTPAPFELAIETPLPSSRTKKPAGQDRADGKAPITPSPSLDELQASLELSPSATAGASHDTDAHTDEGDLSANDDSGTFELAAEPQASVSSTRIASAALAAAMSAKPSAVAAALENREDEVILSPWKEKYIPGGIAVVGVITQIALWFFFANTASHAAIGAAGMLVAEVFILMPIAIVAVFITARIMNIGFGPMVPALIKVAAIAIGTGGVADILFFKMMLSVEFDYQMLLVAFVLHMFLLGLPMLAIFELELSEMVMIVSIIVIPRIVILFGMGWMFPHWF